SIYPHGRRTDPQRPAANRPPSAGILRCAISKCAIHVKREDTKNTKKRKGHKEKSGILLCDLCDCFVIFVSSLWTRHMLEDLTFMMGKFPAVLPGELRYVRNHMWCRVLEDRFRFGFTSYAVRLMQDVYFLDWCVDEGATLGLKQRIGNIETSKAVADLFA